jgi:hypothetical protein
MRREVAEMSKTSKTGKRMGRSESGIHVEEVIVPGAGDLMAGVSARVLVGWMSPNQSNAFIRAFASDEEETVRLTRAGEMRWNAQWISPASSRKCRRGLPFM